MFAGAAMIFAAFIVMAYFICLIMINGLIIAIFALTQDLIRKNFNQYFSSFCLASFLGFTLVDILGNWVWAEIFKYWFAELALLYTLAALLFVSPSFIVLSLLIRVRNPYTLHLPCSKEKVFKFGFLFFSIYTLAIFCIPVYFKIF